MSINGLRFETFESAEIRLLAVRLHLMWSSIPVQSGSDHVHQSNSSVDRHLPPFAFVFLRPSMPARATQHTAIPVESTPLEQGLWHQTCRMTCSIGRPAVASHPKPYLERRARCACFPAPASGNSAPLPSACAMRRHDAEHAGEVQPGAAERGTATMHNTELQVAELQMSSSIALLLLSKVDERALWRRCRMPPVRFLPRPLRCSLLVLVCMCSMSAHGRLGDIDNHR